MGKRPDHGIWPANAPGPLWQPLTAEQRQWRAVAGSAVRAAAQASFGRCPAGRVEFTPGLEAAGATGRGSLPGLGERLASLQRAGHAL